MILQTPDGHWIDDENPYFECPDFIKTLKCNHFYIKCTSEFEISAGKFLGDMLGMFTKDPIGYYLDYLLGMKKTEVKCIHCGLANTKFEHIF